jgi:hypothetical protein
MLRIFVFIALSAPVVAIASDVKRPWRWSDDERIAIRLDPQSMAERAAAREQRRAAAPNAKRTTPQPAFVIEAADPARTSREREIEHSIYEAGLHRYGYTPDEFWQTFGDVARRYYELRDRSRSAGVHGDSAHVELCRERIAVLNAARGRFGSERFNRLLYTVVAPVTSITGRVPGPGRGRGTEVLGGRLSMIVGSLRSF